MQEFSASMPMMLYRALNAVLPPFRKIFAEFGLTEPQWRVMRVLWQVPRVAPGDLAELTLITPPSLVGVIDRLAARGLVARERSAADRRAVEISATKDGIALEAKVMPAVNAAYQQLYASLDETTWAQLSTGLSALAKINPNRQAETPSRDDPENGKPL